MKLRNIFQISAMLLAVSMASCTKDAAPVESTMDTSSDLLTLKDATSTTSTISNKFTDPADGEKGVTLDKKITVNFNNKISPSQISNATFTLTKATSGHSDDSSSDDSKSSSDDNHNSTGSSSVAGTLTFTNTTAVFTPKAPLTANTVYTASITTRSYSKDGSSRAKNSYNWHFTTGAGTSPAIPVITSSDPINNATGVVFNKAIAVTFAGAMDPLTINATTFTIKQGTTAVAGTVTYAGNVATFTPSASLIPNQIYTATITTGAKNLTGIALLSNYTFSFTSASALDVVAPTVTASDPINNATGVASSKVLSVTFSESLTASTISASTFTLKLGTTAVAGTVTYTGTKATFTPSSALSASAIYTATITTGAKDLVGNALAANYTFSFTTAAPVDVTPPTVMSTSPLNNATAVALNKAVTITCSEAMTASTINATTFTMKQGTTAVAGTVTYSGMMATFTPSAALTASTVYTATITTGAKDVAGNALAANTVISFTTVAPVVSGLSFATDVMPILTQCENCHNHGWTASTVASTYYTNLVGSGYVNVASYTSSKIYSGINNGHYGTGISTANSTKIITWMQQGSLNN
jgi:methionine-rich copper-binding protein CopC